MTLLLIACCLTFADIQADYYSDGSLEVASINVDTLTLKGDERNIALNRIARANYKHERFDRAYRIAHMVDYEGFDKLKWDTISLRALLAKNTHRFIEADSLFRMAIDSAKSYPDIMYEVHVNYAELKRLESDYEGREAQLLLALAFAEGWRRDHVIRILARHYFMIMLDFESARQIMRQHSPPDALNPEGKIGYMILQGQYQQAIRNYEKAQQHFMRAGQLARAAGFVSYQRDAADGVMRSMTMVKRERRNNTQWYIFNAILYAVIIGFGIWNFRLEKKINA